MQKRATRKQLLEALDMAAATVELHTGNGAQTQPAWPRDAHGNIDYNLVALRCRDLLNREAAATNPQPIVYAGDGRLA